MAREEPAFVAGVHKQLVELVLKARESKQRVRSHYFNAMKTGKRNFVREYAQVGLMGVSLFFFRSIFFRLNVE